MRATRAAEVLERDHELAALNELIETASRGAGRLAIVHGPAGIGKTELLRAAIERPRDPGVAVLNCSGDPLERDFPFGVVRALFEPVLTGASTARRSELLAGPAGAAATALGLERAGEFPADSDASTLAALHGLYWLTANLAAETPLLIVVDDAQWADPASLRWLAYLGRRLADLPVLLALGVRSGEPESATDLMAAIMAQPLARLIQPAPLTEAATSQLVGAALGAEPEEAFAASCQRATGGNPFLVGQLASALAADGVSPTAGEAERVMALGPETVARALVLRLGHLPAASTALAQALAVLGHGSDLRLVAELAGCDLDEAADGADALARIAIIDDARPLRFVHPIVQAAIHEDIGAGRRARLHGEAARLLAAAGAEPARIASHLVAAEPAADSWVVETLRQAAQDARHRGAPDAAVAYLRRALREPVAANQRTPVLIELGLAEGLMNAPSAAEHLSEAYDRITDPLERGMLASRLARALLNTGAPARGAAIARSAAAELPPGFDDLRRALEAFDLIAILFGSGSPDEQLLRLESQVQPGEAEGVGARMLTAIAALVSAYAARPAEDCVELALEARAGGHGVSADNPVLSIIAIIPLALADRDEAIAAWSEALADTHRRGSLYSLSTIHLWHGFTLLRRGEVAEAEQMLRSGLEGAELYGFDPVVIVYYSAFLTATLLARGDLEGARAALERGKDAPEGSDGKRWWLASRAELLLADGRTEEAVAVAEELEAACGWVANPAVAPWRSLKAQALDRLERDGAIALAEEELALARGFGASGTVGRSLRILGMLEREDGLDHLREAVEVLSGSPARLEHAEALTTLGAALRRGRRRREARDVLRAAADLAHRCGAGALAQRARDELLAAGARPRRLELSGPESLTASEHRVARMAAAGMSNREIAQSLFVSVRTVETHLGHVYRKLDLGSRAGLAAALDPTGEGDARQAALAGEPARSTKDT